MIIVIMLILIIVVIIVLISKELVARCRGLTCTLVDPAARVGAPAAGEAMLC